MRGNANSAVVYGGDQRGIIPQRAEVRPIVLSHMTDKERGIIPLERGIASNRVEGKADIIAKLRT